MLNNQSKMLNLVLYGKVCRKYAFFRIEKASNFLEAFVYSVGPTGFEPVTPCL